VLPGGEGFVQPAKAARMPSREAATQGREVGFSGADRACDRGGAISLSFFAFVDLLDEMVGLWTRSGGFAISCAG
jgi:hypothetical protein